MKAMILAAGKGTRVRPITNDTPKPMIPLLQKPVLESIIEHLKTCGIDEIIINTSYLSSKIENYFGNGSKFGVQIAYSFEGEILEDEIVSKALGSAGGMKKIQDFSKFFDDTFVVLCADALIDLDIQKVIALHKEKKALATIALKQVPINETNKYGIVQLDENDKILTFQEKPDIKDAISDLANTGIYVFEPEIFDYIPSGKEFDIGGDLLPFLAKQDLGIYGVNIPYEWVDIGNVNDFYDATFKILSKEIKGYKINAKEVKEGIFIGLNVKINLDKVKLVPPVYIGSSTQVEDGAIIIGPSMIGSNCEIQEKVILRRSIVDDYKKINTLAKINEKILFSDSIISLDGTVTNTKDSDMTWLIDDTRRKSNKTNLEISISSLLKKRSLR
ncbi:MAG: sugar phosphate nucleotidyltransferase [Poseidonibacter sp.]|uniref:sugar phosphate nucleotidyltransferase n=1 Tax=Poseidonibacter sp. TaxID=2321188 RepID=UPI00359E2A1F